MQALGFSDGPMIFGSASLGGLGSKLAGGDFFQGFATGLFVGAFNHALHGEIDPLLDGRKIYDLTSEELAMFADPYTRP